MLRKLFLIILLIQFAGCSSIQGLIPESGSTSGSGSTTTSKKSTESSTTTASVQKQPSAASIALINESRALQKAGDYSGAASVIERALRIEPGNAKLWLELAQIRLAQKDYSQAQTLAQKALTLSQGDESVERSATQIIQQAKNSG